MDRRMGFLHRLWITPDGGEADEFALERGLRPGPELLHGSDVLPRHGPSFREVSTHDLGFIGQPSGADSDQQPAIGKMIERGDLLGKQDRVALGYQAYSGCNLEMRGR